jgi:hypothetical protein
MNQDKESVAPPSPSGGAITQIPRERAQFRALLLSNPNYFGNLKGSKFPPSVKLNAETTYEELGCVGFQPQFNRLDAVVFIKQQTGYGGGLCTHGSTEYVRFYTSYDNGATWNDEGLSSLQVWDVNFAKAGKRLEYSVAKTIAPPRHFCFQNNFAKVRAILSWNVPPPAADPNYIPIWGNVQNANIQIDPRRLILWSDVLELAKVKLPGPFDDILDKTAPLPVAAPKKLGASELQHLYKDAHVEPHRYALAELQAAAHPAGPSPVLAGGAVPGFIADLKLNLGDLIGKLFPQQGDTRYEQLGCVGYNPDSDELSAVLRVKLPNGYSGGPCTRGSTEFVAFWADTNGNGTFETYIGTTSVNVHDFASLPPPGLDYAVFIPANLLRLRQLCSKGPKLVPIRAILSWNVAPSTVDPNWVPVWGNHEDTLVLVSPGVAVPPGERTPLLTTVGDIPILQIAGSGKATGFGISTGFHASDSPFGGRITIAGHVVNPAPGLKYRLMRKPHGAPDTDYVPLLNEGFQITITTWDMVNGLQQTTQPPTPVGPPADGYFAFEDYSFDHSVEGHFLGHWITTAADHGIMFDLRLSLSTDGNPDHDLTTAPVTVLIDNKAPTALLDIALAPGQQCAHVTQGATFGGHFTATDEHFGSFSFIIYPSGPPNDPPHGALPAPASGTSSLLGGAIADPGLAGAAWSLNTTGMDPCGYALVLRVWDRTNVNSGTTSNYAEASIGFCLEMPA